MPYCANGHQFILYPEAPVVDQNCWPSPHNLVCAGCCCGQSSNASERAQALWKYGIQVEVTICENCIRQRSVEFRAARGCYHLDDGWVAVRLHPAVEIVAPRGQSKVAGESLLVSGHAFLQLSSTPRNSGGGRCAQPQRNEVARDGRLHFAQQCCCCRGALRSPRLRRRARIDGVM
jgi:hypothetical protein